MLQEFFRGFIRIHILHHAEQGPVYGSELAAELKRHGYESISPGTLYPALHGLEKAGYLDVQHRQDAGHWRKFYVLTPRGREILQQIRVKLGELANKVLAQKGDIEDTHEYGRETASNAVVVEAPRKARSAGGPAAGTLREEATPKHLGNQSDQLLHGPLERDGHKPAAPVPFERAGRKDERYWID